MLLPLTESLYVSGILESVDTVLLEIGTGYYVEVGALFGVCVMAPVLLQSGAQEVLELYICVEAQSR